MNKSDNDFLKNKKLKKKKICEEKYDKGSLYIGMRAMLT